MEKKIIWSNRFDWDEFKKWREEMLADPDTNEEWATEEAYQDEIDEWLHCEQDNLDVDVDGFIVCFASLGLWNGRFNAVCRLKGKKVNDIFQMIQGRDIDTYEFFCDENDVKANGIHHDGTNTYMFRIIDNPDQWDEIVERFSADNELTEDEFVKMTTPLRPYVAAVYGW